MVEWREKWNEGSEVEKKHLLIVGQSKGSFGGVGGFNEEQFVLLYLVYQALVVA